MTDVREQAESRLAEALERTGARDPREFYRERLRALRETQPDKFREAVAYFESKLLPEVAGENSDPIAEWLEYGRILTNLVSVGETVQIDPSGRRWPYSQPVPADHLVLHLPAAMSERVLLVGLPPVLSDAQKATYDLLVLRKVS